MNWLNWFLFLILEGDLIVFLIVWFWLQRLHDFFDVYVNSFIPCTARLWNSLPIECFPLTYDLNDFKSRINTFLTVCSFWTEFVYVLIFLYFFFFNSMFRIGCLPLHVVNPDQKKSKQDQMSLTNQGSLWPF